MELIWWSWVSNWIILGPFGSEMTYLGRRAQYATPPHTQTHTPLESGILENDTLSSHCSKFWKLLQIIFFSVKIYFKALYLKLLYLSFGRGYLPELLQQIRSYLVFVYFHDKILKQFYSLVKNTFGELSYLGVLAKGTHIFFSK